MKVVFTREEKLIIERFASMKLNDNDLDPCTNVCGYRDRILCCQLPPGID